MDEKKKKTEQEKEASDGREAARKKAISQITKKYGQGSIMKLGENTNMQVSAIPTLP